MAVLGASYDGHVPKYKLVNEAYTDEYVTNDYTVYYLKPEHLMTHDKRCASLLEIKKKGMERRHREYDKRCGGNKDKKHDLKDQWIKVVDREHKRAHRCQHQEKAQRAPM